MIWTEFELWIESTKSLPVIMLKCLQYWLNLSQEKSTKLDVGGVDRSSMIDVDGNTFILPDPFWRISLWGYSMAAALWGNVKFSAFFSVVVTLLYSGVTRQNGWVWQLYADWRVGTGYMMGPAFSVCEMGDQYTLAAVCTWNLISHQ